MNNILVKQISYDYVDVDSMMNRDHYITDVNDIVQCRYKYKYSKMSS